MNVKKRDQASDVTTKHQIEVILFGVDSALFEVYDQIYRSERATDVWKQNMYLAVRGIQHAVSALCELVDDRDPSS